MGYVPLDAPIGKVLMGLVKEKNPSARFTVDSSISFTDVVPAMSGDNNTRVTLTGDGISTEGSVDVFYTRLDIQTFFEDASVEAGFSDVLDLGPFYVPGMTNGDVIGALATIFEKEVNISHMEPSWLSSVPPIIDGDLVVTVPSGDLIWLDNSTLSVPIVSGECSLNFTRVKDSETLVDVPTFFVNEDAGGFARWGVIRSGGGGISLDLPADVIPPAARRTGEEETAADAIPALSVMSGVDFEAWFNANLSGNSYAVQDDFNGGETVAAMSFTYDPLYIIRTWSEQDGFITTYTNSWSELITAFQGLSYDEEMVTFVPYRIHGTAVEAGWTVAPLYGTRESNTEDSNSGLAQQGFVLKNTSAGRSFEILPGELFARVNTVPESAFVDLPGPISNTSQIINATDFYNGGGSPETKAWSTPLRTFPQGSVFAVDLDGGPYDSTAPVEEDYSIFFSQTVSLVAEDGSSINVKLEKQLDYYQGDNFPYFPYFRMYVWGVDFEETVTWVTPINGEGIEPVHNNQVEFLISPGDVTKIAISGAVGGGEVGTLPTPGSGEFRIEASNEIKRVVQEA